MNAIIRKEIRLLLPAALAGLLLAALPLIPQIGCNNLYAETSSLALCGLGALIVGISVFGQEVAAGTLGLFLVQPLSRQELWRIKMRVLRLAAVVTLAVPCLYCWSHSGYLPGGPHKLTAVPVRWVNTILSPLPLLIVAAAFISGGLWTTLVFRQVAAAFWIALLIPMGLVTLLEALFEPAADGSISPWQIPVMLAVLAAYSIASFWLARRIFLKAQDTSWTGGALAFSFGRTAWLSPLSALPRSPWVSLVHKELQLQQTTFFVVIAMALFQVATFALHKVVRADPQNSLFQILELSWVLWLVVPLVVGGSAVAEERRMNTLEGALCLPVPRRTQFFIKLVVTLFLGTLLGGLFPATLLWLGGWIETGKQHPGELMGGFCGAAAGLTLVCFYGSSLTRNLLQALGATIAIVTIGAAAVRILLMVPLFVVGEMGNSPLMYWNPLVAWWGCGIALAIILLWLPYRNFLQSRPDGKLWFFNLSMVASALVSVALINVAVMERTWEFFIPLEPRHGAVRLAGPVQPKLVERYGILLALLPDGRLWLAQKMETRTIQDDVHTKTNGVEPMITRVPFVPLSGTFVGSSNWIDAAAGRNDAVALQADGSLWRVSEGFLTSTRQYVISNRVPFPAPASFSMAPQIFTAKPPVLERIGADSDWQSVVAGEEFFLALKKDGTLWGWGGNRSGVLGALVEQETNCPVRVGTDSDWLRIFASHGSCTAIKQDGSEWRWGYLNCGPHGENNKDWNSRHVEPVRYPLVGTNWVSISGSGSTTFALDADGNLWGYGILPETVQKWPWQRPESWNYHAPLKIESSQWRQIADYTGIRRDGTLWSHSFYSHNERKESRYTDWIAIPSGDLSALAADGTISHWDAGWWGSREAQGMLPTRKPAWNVNILEAKNAP